jgi:phytoene dehydrogenase-like protein
VNRSGSPLEDAVIVGSGINSLTCAALLARAGWSVRVLERNDSPGGAIRSEELSLAGFLHDVFSCWHSTWLSGEAHQELGGELAEQGLEYLNTDLPAASAFPDGSAAFLLRTPAETASEFERHGGGDGDAWSELVAASAAQASVVRYLTQREFGLRSASELALQTWRRLGRTGLAELSTSMLEPSRDWLSRTFVSEQVRGLLAPWVLHAGLGPDAAGSAFATKLVTLGKQRVGSPLPRGGGARLVDALVAVIEAHGGLIELGCDVERVLIEDGRARGVALAGGERRCARRAVICNVTPTQLYGRLISDPDPRLATAARRYRYGLSGMQIHYALAEPARWAGDARLNGSAVIHLTAGLDGVSRAVNEAQRGLLPADPTIVVGQPLTVDPSRAPVGSGMLWVQISELPWRVRGDAAELIETGAGAWDETLRERYAERVHAQLARQIVNLDSATRARTALSPADLQAANINLQQGDPYSGAVSLDQSIFWRPFPRGARHRTPFKDLWHIGASSHPGPGLSGTSGYLVAKTLIAARRPRRAQSTTNRERRRRPA